MRMHTERIGTLIGVGVIVLGVQYGTACIDPGEAGDEVAAVRSDVAWAGTRYRLITTPISEDTIEGFLLGSTGAIAHYGTIDNPEGGKIRNATCGATFLSSHFAITASHCIEGANGGGFLLPRQMYIDRIDVSGTILATRQAEGTVTGTYPNWDTGISTDLPAGYSRSRYTCKWVCRGRTTDANVDACRRDLMNNSVSTQDVALVECKTRVSDYWVESGNTMPTVGTQVTSVWFHEWLNMPNTAPLPSPPPTPDALARWERYVGYRDFDAPTNGTLDDNFHYGWEHLLWPMLSDEAPSGGPASVVASNGGPTSTNTPTDLYGCHGTSGSGVFQRGYTIYLGPIQEAPGTSRLCTSNTAGVLTAESTLVTAKLALDSRVTNDRNGIYTPSY